MALQMIKQIHDMKKLIYIVTFLSTTLLFGLERPAKVPSKITELRTKSWYQEVANNWKSYLEANPSDENGWIDYFKASEYAGNSRTTLELIAKAANSQFPESFSSDYLAFKLAGWSEEGVAKLQSLQVKDADNLYALEDYLALMDLIDRKQRSNVSSKVYC